MTQHSAAIIEEEGALHREMRQWRRDFHSYPETAFEEHRTAGIVAQLLESFGLEVHTEIAVTGVVGVLHGQLGEGGSIALRADMDALNLQELNSFEHCSKHPGKMHGCGHDGHTAMLLGAAKHLAENPQFAGSVVFIFQPAEEGEAGAKAMCDQGLFERFDVDAVYGMHNWPGLPEGHFAVHNGPVMASMDVFDIEVTGQGGHGGMPHLGIDPVLVAGQLISALQSIVARSLNPLDSGVVSITRMSGGDAYNVIPEKVVLSGTCRAFSEQVQQQLESKMRCKVEHICAAYGAKGTLDYRRVYPATVNTQAHAAHCAQVCRELVGESSVSTRELPSMGAEDFAFMLQQRQGAYIWVGNGRAGQGHGLHNPNYDFNDAILPLGASYWVSLVQHRLNP
ncbi:MAG: M20 aminoacylase family protein [Pseudomonadales bacterium]